MPLVCEIDGMSAVTTFQTADGCVEQLAAAPIDPADILDGVPEARSHQLLCADDDRLSTSIWDCTAGRFNWTFPCDEIVHIVDGEVTVTDEQCRSRTLRAGDIALFQRDTTTEWDVPQYVRKIAIHRIHRDALASRVLRRLRRTGAERRVPATA